VFQFNLSLAVEEKAIDCRFSNDANINHIESVFSFNIIENQVVDEQAAIE
jgi:hypothetical protein